MDYILTAESLSKNYRRFQALDNFSIHVPKGGILFCRCHSSHYSSRDPSLPKKGPEVREKLCFHSLQNQPPIQVCPSGSLLRGIK